jgi:predicted Zn-dependent peptidase
MWDPFAEFQSAKLPNGLTVYAAHWPRRPWEAMGFLIHSGAAQDPIGLEGIAHFVEHVVVENTPFSLGEIEATFTDYGGRVNLGTTGYFYTYFNFFVPIDKELLKRAFSIFGYMLLSAKLEKSIDAEREIIINEFHQVYPDKLKFDLKMRERKAVYSGYWFERFATILGTPESIALIEQKDLQRYYDTHYTPANMSIVGVGGMTLEELIELLSQSPFALYKKGERTPLPKPITDVKPPLETRYVVEMSKYTKIPLKTGTYRSVTKIPGKIHGAVIAIMRNMVQTLLSEEIRERRSWAYEIYVSQYDFPEFCEFIIHCDSLKLQAIDEIEKLIEDCIASIENRKNLFEQVKRRLLAALFMSDTTAREVCDNALLDLARYQRIKSQKEIYNELEAVTINDIGKALKYLHPDRRWTLIIRP